MKFARILARNQIARCVFSERLWFRRVHGGRWARVWIDHPVMSCLWLDVPDHAGPGYSEPGWRGTPEFVSYP